MSSCLEIFKKEDRQTDSQSNARPTPETLVWIALTFFRHWVSQRLIGGKGRDTPDCGYELYAALGAGGDRYMDKSP